MQTETFIIDGMTCGGCTASVTRALQRVAGVRDAAVTLAPPLARVTFDPQVVNGDALKKAIEDAGYGVGA